jgi:proteasome accessory factor B
MAEHPPLIRQWILLRHLSSSRHGITVKDLADELQVGEKTIRRDLDMFRLAGFPLEETVHEHGRKTWRLHPAKTQPGLTFAFDEAISLYLGRRFLEPLAGTVFWDAAQRAFQKIRACLGAGALRYLDRFTAIFHQTTFGISDDSEQSDLIDQLVLAIEERRITQLTYQSLRSTEPTSYDVYPYGLTYHRGALYLVGHSPDHNAVRHWKVNRIEHVELLELRFNPPEKFDLAAHFAKSFGIFEGHGEVHVKIRFASSVVRYVEESRWHPSQKLTRHKDGSLLAEFGLSSTEEIKAWILSFGRHAVVEEPKELRTAISGEVAALAGAYGVVGAVREGTQMVRSSTSPPSGGAVPSTGSRCKATASRILRRASSSVSPSETHPGNEGM